MQYPCWELSPFLSWDALKRPIIITIDFKLCSDINTRHTAIYDKSIFIYILQWMLNVDGNVEATL